MKITKKTKIAILTFVALGLTGVGILKAKKLIDNRKRKNKKPTNNGVLNVIFDLPDSLK